jgi:hypothetical protein
MFSMNRAAATISGMTCCFCIVQIKPRRMQLASARRVGAQRRGLVRLHAKGLDNSLVLLSRSRLAVIFAARRPDIRGFLLKKAVNALASHRASSNPGIGMLTTSANPNDGCRFAGHRQVSRRRIVPS